jgi:predicted AlkP superfamily pyrophosphatase or phosphodiesterase
MRPSDWRQYDGNITMEARVDQVLNWLDRPIATRPAFITLYFDAVDTAGHNYGPEAKETLAAIASVDAAVKRLVDGLKARGHLAATNLVIVADHGMVATSSKRVVWVEDMVDSSIVEPLPNGGPLLGFTPLPGKEAEATRALLTPRPHVQCWRKAELPARFDYGHNPRVPPIICLAETGWWLSTRTAFERKPPSGGAHGYDPDNPQMAALFIAHGPAFRAGERLDPFSTMDIYPLLAQLLGITPQANQGNLATFASILLP